jgi:hypothetical protein
LSITEGSIHSATTTDPSAKTARDRLPALAGFAFVAATVVCIGLSAGGPTPGDSASELATSLSSSDFADRMRTAALLYGVGAAAFVVFLVGLAQRVRHVVRRLAAARPDRSGLVLPAGMVVIGLELVSAALIAAYPETVRLFGAANATDVSVALVIQTVSWWVAEYAGLVAVVMMAATGVAGVRNGSLPRWFGWMSLATAVLSLVASVVNLAPIALIVWTLAGSIALLSSPSEPA